MKFKYKDLELSCKIEANIDIINSQKCSLINGKNLQLIDGKISKIYDTINEDEIELIPETLEEEVLLAEETKYKISSNTNTIIKTENPTTTSNLKNIYINDDYMWINKISGELFICIDDTIDKNIWIGQLGTKITVPELTIEGIEAEGLVIHFDYNIRKGNIIKSTINNFFGLTGGIGQSKRSINGYAAYFNKNSLKIDNIDIDLSNDISICTWIYPKINRWTQNIIYKDYKSEFSIVLNKDLTISFYHGDGTSYRRYDSSLKLVLNKYNFLSIIRESGGIKIYISYEFNELVLDNTNVTLINDDFDNTDLNQSSNNIIIGKGDRGSFKGYLDDTYIFKRALSFEELNKIKDKFKKD